jgi:hypothetical protein
MLAGYPGVMATPTATDGGTGTTASVAFTTVSGATGYTALSNPGSLTGTGTSSPITVSGLTEGTAYTFQVRAENSEGQGGYSAASNSVTVAVPPSYESIATLNGTGSSNTITFNSIPTTYKHLQIRYSARAVAGGTGGDALYMRYNGVTTSTYSSHELSAGGSSINAGAAFNQNRLNAIGSTYSNYPTGSDLAGCYGVGIINIYDYASTVKTKTHRGLGGYDTNGSGAMGAVGTGFLNSTAAISSITVYTNNNFTTDTYFALYGIKG